MQGTLMQRSSFLGERCVKAAASSGSRYVLRGAKGSQIAKKAQSAVKKAASSLRQGGVGYRRYQGDALWLPNTQRPEWLDGSLPGDRGFDPLGLAKPSDFVQIGVDQEDLNASQNLKGSVEGQSKANPDQLSTNRLSPYSEAFGLQRFRECEVIHGRWAMLACLGAFVAESATGVNWAEAGKVELDGAQYLGFSLPFTVSQLTFIEAVLVGTAEVYRNTELDPERRIYPGGVFDPLGLASDTGDRAFRLKTAELKHGRLAMVSFLGYSVQYLTTGQGVIGSLGKFGNSFGNAGEVVEAVVGAQ